VVIHAGEVETLIATRHKMGYMLNADRKNILILFSVSALRMSFDDSVVIGMAADPEPQKPFRYLNSQCPIMHADTD